VAAAVALVAALGVAGWLLTRSGDEPLAGLVPADALVYVRAGTDADRKADVALVRRLERLPGVRRVRDAAIARIGAQSPGFSFARDVRPWLGDEAAFALLRAPGGGTAAEGLLVARVRDRNLFRLFVSRAGARLGARHRGVDVARASTFSAAVTDDVLILGQDAGVRAALDLAAGDGASLADAAPFVDAEPRALDDAALELYASRDGARGVLAPRAPALGLLARPRLESLRAVAAADGRNVRVRLRAAGAARGAAAFSPRLARTAPRGVAGVLALPGADALLGRLFATAPPLVAAARTAGVDVQRDLLAPLRRGEAVVWATPGPAVSAAFVARTRDPARTREALGRLQAPLSAALSPGEAGAGQVPQFEQRRVAGADAFALPLAAGAELVYAVAGDRLVIATSEAAAARALRAGPGALEAAEAQKRIEIPRDGVEAVLFTVPGQLLALGDQLGITAGPAVAAVRDDLARVRAISAVAQSKETDTTAELFFHIP
jgi:hypothetical protein